MYKGDFPLNANVELYFTSQFSGLPTSLSGTPNSIGVYKDDVATLSISGVTLSQDFNGRAGLNVVKITTSSDPTFYASGHDFGIIIISGTVGGVSAVGYVVGSFSIQNRYSSPTGIVWSNLDAPVSSRMASGTVSVGDKTGFSLTTPQNFNLIGNISGTLQGNVNGYVGQVTGSVMSLVSGSTGGASSDPLLNAVPGAYGAGTAGFVLGTNLDVKVSSRMPTGSLANLDAPISSRLPTGSLGNLDVAVSSRIASGTVSLTAGQLTNLDVPVSSRMPTGSLANLDVLVSSRMPTGSLANLDVSVSSRMASGTVVLAAGQLGNLDVPVSSRMPTGSLGNLDAAVSSRMSSGTVVVGTNNDKSGYSLSTPQNFNLVGNISGTSVGNRIGNIQGSVANVTGSVGGVIGLTPSFLDVAVSSRMASGTVSLTAGQLNNLDVPVSSRLPTGSLGNLDVLVSSRQPTGAVVAGTVQDKTGYSLSTPQSFNLIGNISGTLQGNINGNLIGNTSGTQVGNIQGNILGYVGWVTGSVMSIVSGTSAGGGATAAQVWTYGTRQLTDPQNFNLIGNVSGTLTNVYNLISGTSASPSLSQIVNGVWDEQISGHLITGSTGKSLNGASSAGDPWATSIPGAYGAGSAGNILGNKLDANISSRMISGSVVVGQNNDKSGYNVSGLTTPQYLDAYVSSRMPSGVVTLAGGQLTFLDVPVSSRMPTGSLGNLDVPISSRQATGAVTVTQSQLLNLDVPISSRMPTGSLGNLDVPVSSRMATGTVQPLPTGVAWANLDVPISSRMPTGSLAFLDVPVSSRMPTGATVALPTGIIWTNLDVPVSSRMPTGTSFTLPTGIIISFPTGIIVTSYVTLGQPAVQMISALQGAIIMAIKHDTLTLQFQNLGSLVGRTKLYFTVKSSPDDDDTQSAIQIEESGGLLYIDGAVGVAGKGSLAVTNALLGNLTVTLDASEMSKLDLGQYTYDIKIVRASGIPVTTLTMNVFNVVSDSTWAIT